MKGEQQALVTPHSSLERFTSNAQHPLGVSLPSQEIGSGCSGLPVLFVGCLCCTLAWLMLILCGLPDICNSLTHSKAVRGPDEPFQEALGFTWHEGHHSALILWFLPVLRSLGWMQCEGAANPLLVSGISSSLVEPCRSDHGGSPCQST